MSFLNPLPPPPTPPGNRFTKTPRMANTKDLRHLDKDLCDPDEDLWDLPVIFVTMLNNRALTNDIACDRADAAEAREDPRRADASERTWVLKPWRPPG